MGRDSTQSVGSGSEWWRRRQSAANRWLEWLFQRGALAQAMAAPPLPVAEREQLALARAAIKLADYVATASDPVHDLGKQLSQPAAAELALRLYRDVCLWALHDLAEIRGDLASAVAQAPRSKLLAAAGGEDELKALENS